MAKWFERPRKRGPVPTQNIAVEGIAYARLTGGRVHFISPGGSYLQGLGRRISCLGSCACLRAESVHEAYPELEKSFSPPKTTRYWLRFLGPMTLKRQRSTYLLGWEENRLETLLSALPTQDEGIPILTR